MRDQGCDKHGAGDGEDDHGHRRFLFGRTLRGEGISFDRFLHVEADGEIKRDGVAIVVLARDSERSVKAADRPLRRGDRELRLPAAASP